MQFGSVLIFYQYSYALCGELALEEALDLS